MDSRSHWRPWRRRPTWERAGRFQIDCALESRLPSSRMDDEPPNSLEEVKEFLELTLKQEVKVTCCNGRFFIPKTELPIQGFVRLLLEVSAGVGKAKMNLTGASFDIDGRLPYEEVRWKLRPHKNKDEADEVDLTISAFPGQGGRLGSQLEKTAILLSQGVQELVIGAGE